jgi:DnaJ-class molecular chaperone
MKIENDLCMTCYGTGNYHGDHCPRCNGTGIASNHKARSIAFALFVVLWALAIAIWFNI